MKVSEFAGGGGAVSRVGREVPQHHPQEETQLEVPRSVLFSCSVVSNSLRSHGLQHARLPCPSPSPGACSNSHVYRIGDAIQPSHPLLSLLLLLSIFPSIRVFSKELVLRIRWPKYLELSLASASVLPMNIQD
ncbi:unnamed protein product [Rangifer tarandus platyrhynchus]|uniref:Uncharacterized protein n=2 Tax=Rangifer tarandus platyrhynchus TaxID=3082113 RepID=A0AC59YJU9_RANTA|nr:unnamed protein product [Rangifer tarandus platyrhynchus]